MHLVSVVLGQALEESLTTLNESQVTNGDPECCDLIVRRVNSAALKQLEFFANSELLKTILECDCFTYQCDLHCGLH
ncbi:unnamed protein product [Caretta caretta]